VIDLATLADFLNTRDERNFGEHTGKPDADRDLLERPADFRLWLASQGLAAANVRVAQADLELARRLRKGLRDVLSAAGENPASRRDLAAVAAELALTVDFSGSEPALARADTPARAALAQLLGACIAAAAQGRWARLKMCSAEDCRWVFHDTSRNRLGRWCAMDVCGNRVKTRRYRERQRSHAKSADPV
jgi:predicted RNA-binding Zn ribbon-like protein